jgi:hypothetical protein
MTRRPKGTSPQGGATTTSRQARSKRGSIRQEGREAGRYRRHRLTTARGGRAQGSSPSARPPSAAETVRHRLTTARGGRARGSTPRARPLSAAETVRQDRTLRPKGTTAQQVGGRRESNKPVKKKAERDKRHRFTTAREERAEGSTARAGPRTEADTVRQAGTRRPKTSNSRQGRSQEGSIKQVRRESERNRRHRLTTARGER